MPFLRRTRAASFSPTDISGCKLWLPADGTLWQDSARTTPATADGDPVGAWDDNSGQGNNALQASSTQRPLYKTGIQNSKPVLRFDGSNDRLQTSAFTLSQPCTIFAVLIARMVGITQGIFDGTGDFTRYVRNTAGASHPLTLYAGSILDGDGITQDVAFIAQFVFNGASSAITKNANSPTTGNAGSAAATGLTLGGNASGGENGQFDFAEVIAYDSAIAGADITSVLTYLNGKYVVY